MSSNNNEENGKPLEVSKDSWHYKFLRMMDIVPGNSLCTYFWTVAGAIFLAVAGSIFVTMGAVAMLAFLLIPFANLVWDLSWAIVLLSLFIWGLLFLAIINDCKLFWKSPVRRAKKQDKLSQRKEKKELRKEKAGAGVFQIIAGFLKAKKDKVCPKIVFID